MSMLTTMSPSIGGGGSSTPSAGGTSAWDSNSNMSANNFLTGYATTATAAGTTTLTVGSAGLQFFTGTTTQTVTLPVASTLVLGQSFFIANNSTGVVTVQSSGGNAIQAMAANTTLVVTCILTSGTGTASWNAVYDYKDSVAGGVTSAQIQNQSFTFAVSSGSTNALAITLSPAPAAYADGQLFIVRANATNTASASINVNSLGAKTIYVDDAGTGPSALIGGEIQGGHSYLFVYNGALSSFYLVNPSFYNSLVLKGTTTNNSAATGIVGEYVSAVVLVGSAVSLTTATAKTITSISLTAGDWDVWGDFGPDGAATTVIQNISGGISLTNNTMPTEAADNATAMTSGTVSFTIGTHSLPYYNLTPARISIASTTTVYLIMQLTFTTSTATGYGKICARRVR